MTAVQRRAPATAAAPPRHTLRLRGRSVPVVLPARDDPRLRLSVVIVSLQVLGQTVLGFKLSAAQILVCVGACVLLDVPLTLLRERALVWPGSALLTGNSTAFILRGWGTRHGDWWSVAGIDWFLLACAIAVLSKHLIRIGGRHVYNPSNMGLVAVLLIAGVPDVFPQYLWWGPIGAPVALALAVIVTGAAWVLRSVGMVWMAVAFLAPFALAVGGLAAGGRCFVASWHSGPVCGGSYWIDICTSPELLVFVFFMMSDPRTAPRDTRARVVYGAATALVAATLLAFQPAEFGVKLAILAALTVVCSFVPLLDAVMRRQRIATTTARSWVAIAVIAVVAVTAAVPLGVARLASNRQVVDIESGVPPPGTPPQ